jgi:thiol-disulfide isomerase/thioredoxin
MKHLLLGYGLVLTLLLVYFVVVREGFESSPKTVMQDIANKKVLLFISRSDCGHCQNMKEAWEKAAAKQPEKMVMIDATDASNPDVEKLLSKLNVTSYPAIFVMDNGEEVKQYEGGRSEQDLLAEVSTI